MTWQEQVDELLKIAKEGYQTQGEAALINAVVILAKELAGRELAEALAKAPIKAPKA